ncbi:insulinase family protein [Oceanobacillus oncorhynchi]|uniref:insulinase family protein n=1 Tax=Oceanobacillus oncorhynchi TaxID=545501 RepID=UPI001867B1E9|nr:insulinase family protein [Oceanobacillus oncorhynchi]
MYQNQQNLYNFKLNGANLIIHHKPEFNTQYTSIELPFGGLSKYLLLDEKIINIEPGSAHLLEHSVLDTEDNNFFSYFMRKGARCNGYTHLASTVFSFEMVKLDLIVLQEFLYHIIEGEVNNETLTKQKEIILSEINSRNPFPPIIKHGLKKILQNEYNYFTVIGESNDVENLDKINLVLLKKYIYSFNHLDLITFGPKDPNEIIDWFKNIMKLNSDKSQGKIKWDLNNNNETSGLVVCDKTDLTLLMIFKEKIINNVQMIKKQTIMRTFMELCIEGFIKINGNKLEAHMDYFNNLGISIFMTKASSEKEFIYIKSLISKSESGVTNNLNNDTLDLIKTKIISNLLAQYDYPDRISTQLHWLSRYNYSLDDYILMVQNVTTEEVNEHIEYLFSHIDNNLAY